MIVHEALAIVLEAAGRWAAELDEYIIPGADPGDKAGYVEQRDKILQAIEILEPKGKHHAGTTEG